MTGTKLVPGIPDVGSSILSLLSCSVLLLCWHPADMFLTAPFSLNNPGKSRYDVAQSDHQPRAHQPTRSRTLDALERATASPCLTRKPRLATAKTQQQRRQRRTPRHSPPRWSRNLRTDHIQVEHQIDKLRRSLNARSSRTAEKQELPSSLTRS